MICVIFLLAVISMCNCDPQTKNTEDQAISDINITTNHNNQFLISWNSTDAIRYIIQVAIIKSSFKRLTNYSFKEISRIYSSFNTPSYMTLHEIPYYSSTTYRFSVDECKCQHSNGHNCLHEECTLFNSTYNTAPLKPTMQMAYGFCETQCELFIDVNNVQSNSSFLYLFAKNLNISIVDFETVSSRLNKHYVSELGKVIAMQNASSISGRTTKTFKVSNMTICAYEIFVIARNDYEEKFNYSVLKPKLKHSCFNRTLIEYIEGPHQTTSAFDSISSKNMTTSCNDCIENSTTSFQIDNQNTKLGNNNMTQDENIGDTIESPTTPNTQKSFTKSYVEISTTSTNGFKEIGNQSYIYVILIILLILIIIGIVLFLVKTKKQTKNNDEIHNDENIPLTKKTYTSSMSVSELASFLDNPTTNVVDIINLEYSKIPLEIGNLIPDSIDYNKNRCRHILPYEKNRVTLQSDNLESNYINASYVKGFEHENKFIATQAPLKETASEFWRMIFDQEVTLVVMLTNFVEDGRCKCYQYWPESGENHYKNIIVSFQSVRKQTDYVTTDLKISSNGESRGVKHLHFTSWTSREAPLTPLSLVMFLKVTRKHKTTTPIVVHCSAGVGRTGGFILCDYLIDMAKTGSVDFVKALYTLRKCRMQLVSQKIYYLYCYCVVNEFLKESTDMTIEDFKNIYSQNMSINLCRSAYWLNILQPCRGHPKWAQNKNKHKTPEEPLSSLEFVSAEKYFIDAIEIPIGNKKFINTSQPLSSGKGEFWKMILDREVVIILSLHSVTKSTRFWPTSTEQKIVPEKNIEISFISLGSRSDHDCYRLQVKDIGLPMKWQKEVVLLDFKNWNRHSLPNTSDFLNFYRNFILYQSATSVAVACYDGTLGCSIFLTFVHLIETSKVDLTIDIPMSVSTLQVYRRSLYVNEVALEFVCTALYSFLTGGTDYQNIHIENC